MATSNERRIRERAYDLWVEGGHRHGTSEQDWLRAEREVAAAGETGAAARDETAKRSKDAAKAAKPAEGGNGAAKDTKKVAKGSRKKDVAIRRDAGPGAKSGKPA